MIRLTTLVNLDWVVGPRLIDGRGVLGGFGVFWGVLGGFGGGW